MVGANFYGCRELTFMVTRTGEADALNRLVLYIHTLLHLKEL